MRASILVGLTAIVLLNAACSSAPVAPASTSTAAAPAPSHHRPEGFQNNHINFQPRSLSELLTWKWQALRAGVPKPPAAPIPQVAPDRDFVASNGIAGPAMQPAVTWIGHASTLVQLGGLNVLTDPIFSERASPVQAIGPRRAQPPGLTLAQLPRIDVVVISHNHYDHLDEDSVVGLSAQRGGSPLFLVPLGHKAWFAERGVHRVRELDWWQTHRVGRVDFTLTPVQHWSGRGLNDRMQSLWGGWAMLAPDFSVYFAGDTGYSKDFAEIGQRLAAPRGGFDLALIPIGAYEPRWFMTEQHVNPPEAVQMHRDLRARRSLGIHWGAFELTDEPLDEPPRALARARQAAGLPEDDFFVLAVGETRKLPRRVPDAAAK